MHFLVSRGDASEGLHEDRVNRYFSTWFIKSILYVANVQKEDVSIEHIHTGGKGSGMSVFWDFLA